MDIAKEIGLAERSLEYRRSWNVGTEEELKGMLKTILNSKKVTEVVSSILRF